MYYRPCIPSLLQLLHFYWLLRPSTNLCPRSSPLKAPVREISSLPRTYCSLCHSHFSLCICDRGSPLYISVLATKPCTSERAVSAYLSNISVHAGAMWAAQTSGVLGIWKKMAHTLGVRRDFTEEWALELCLRAELLWIKDGEEGWKKHSKCIFQDGHKSISHPKVMLPSSYWVVEPMFPLQNLGGPETVMKVISCDFWGQIIKGNTASTWFSQDTCSEWTQWSFNRKVQATQKSPSVWPIDSNNTTLVNEVFK